MFFVRCTALLVRVDEHAGNRKNYFNGQSEFIRTRLKKLEQYEKFNVPPPSFLLKNNLMPAAQNVWMGAFNTTLSILESEQTNCCTLRKLFLLDV